MKTYEELLNEIKYVQTQINNTEIEIEHYQSMWKQWQKRLTSVKLELAVFESV